MNKLNELLCRVLDFLHKNFGSVRQEFAPVKATTTPVARVNDAAQIIARRNQARAEMWLHNASISTLYIGLEDGIDTGKYALRIAPQDTLILNAVNYASLYKDEIYGFWESGAASTSKCMVTEFYKVGQ